uniref:NADH-ubiquinone oxidoreductase chain 4 n=1 Tax=Microcondylaea bonellii TaxID=1678567 RepID=A0A513X0D6_9BIVA|nr:NADH dehydrogenase subunit 4 [Microcondylaea bonellii]
MFSLVFVPLVGLVWAEKSWWVVAWGFQLSVVLVVLGSFMGMGVPECSFGEVFCCDEISYGFIWLSIFVAGLSLLGSNDTLKVGDSSQMFLIVVVGLLLTLCVCFAAGSLFLFYVFFEFSLIPTLVVICGWGYQPERLRAGKYMMLYTVGASLPLLAFILFAFYAHGSASFVLLYAVRGVFHCGSVMFMGSILAFLVKSPMYGVHGWLPKAHVEAPVAGSMFLAGVLLKLGGYGLTRFIGLLNLSNSVVYSCVVCLCIFGGVMASVVCCVQVDAKSLVAYSSVGHMSLVLGGLMSGSFWGLGGSYFLMIAHGLSSSGMFYLVSELYKAYSSRMLFVIRGGIGNLFGLNLWLAFMCGFNAAAPPSLSLFSEIILCISIVSYSLWFSVLVGALGFLSCLYSWSLYCSTQMGNYPIWAYSSKGVSDFHILGVVCSSISFCLVGLSFCSGIGKFS